MPTQKQQTLLPINSIPLQNVHGFAGIAYGIPRAG